MRYTWRCFPSGGSASASAIMLIYQLLEEGPESLTQAEKRWLISDPETLCLLHTLTWSEEPMDAETDTPVLAAA